MFEIALTVCSICELATACSLIARCIGRGAPSAYAVEIAANPAKASRALMDKVGTDFRGITCLQFRYRGSGKPEAFRPYKAAAHCRNSYERRCARRSRSRREPTKRHVNVRNGARHIRRAGISGVALIKSVSPTHVSRRLSRISHSPFTRAAALRVFVQKLVTYGDLLGDRVLLASLCGPISGAALATRAASPVSAARVARQPSRT